LIFQIIKKFIIISNNPSAYSMTFAATPNPANDAIIIDRSYKIVATNFPGFETLSIVLKMLINFITLLHLSTGKYDIARVSKAKRVPYSIADFIKKIKPILFYIK
jgi:hypothetical protein